MTNAPTTFGARFEEFVARNEWLASMDEEERHELVKFMLFNDYDHAGQAELVARLFPNQFRHNKTHGWYAWQDTHWDRKSAESSVVRAVDSAMALRRHVGRNFDVDSVKKMLVSSRSNAATVSGVMTMLGHRLDVEGSHDAFDAMPDHLNVANGTLNLRTGELQDHHQSDHLTYCLDIPYDAPAEGETPNPEIWLNFLDSVGFDSDMVDHLQLAIGYTLTGRTDERAMWYLHGPSASGKGTITETLLALMGHAPLATGLAFSTFTSPRYGDTQNFDLAPLTATRLVVASESGRYDRMNEALFKTVVGGDPITCAFKGKTHFSYFPQFKIWLSSNHPPMMDVDDDAAWGRVRLINMTRSFLGREDKGLKRALKDPANLRRLLPWAVEGARRWYEMGARGIEVPDFIKTANQEARDEMDTVGRFIEEMCDVGEGNFAHGQQLYMSYKFWCEDNGYTPKRRRSFGQSMTAKDYRSDTGRLPGHINSVRGYVGLKLRQ